jgi:hypothetical protein
MTVVPQDFQGRPEADSARSLVTAANDFERHFDRI